VCAAFAELIKGGTKRGAEPFVYNLLVITAEKTFDPESGAQGLKVFKAGENGQARIPLLLLAC